MMVSKGNHVQMALLQVSEIFQVTHTYIYIYMCIYVYMYICIYVHIQFAEYVMF